MLETVKSTVNAVLGSKPRPGGAVCDDMDLLAPAFRVRVERVVADMRAEGFQPRVFETFRSVGRATLLAARGTGVVQSLHCLGLAADIIDARKLWSAGPSFWLSLQRNAVKHGLVSGASWRRHDLPHIQAIPVVSQALARRLFAERGQSAVNQYVATVLA